MTWQLIHLPEQDTKICFILDFWLIIYCIIDFQLATPADVELKLTQTVATAGRA
jgi:hypothetical protein